MKKVALFLVSILLLIWSFSITAEIKTITNYPPKNQTIVAFGDSLVEGYNANDRNSKAGGFVSILSSKIGRPIINKGHYGDTTEDGLARIKDVTDLNPGIVLVLFGGNDTLEGKQPSEVFYNLQKIITTLEAHGATVILLGVRNGILVDTYSIYFKKLAENTGSLYIPDVLNGLFQNSLFMSDPVHPNAFGYELIANKIYPELNKLLMVGK